jgi:hypothetical protein
LNRARAWFVLFLVGYIGSFLLLICFLLLIGEALIGSFLPLISFLFPVCICCRLFGTNVIPRCN